jgi:hypothetical protein
LQAPGKPFRKSSAGFRPRSNGARGRHYLWGSGDVSGFLLERAGAAHFQAKRKTQSLAKNVEAFSLLYGFFESKTALVSQKIEPSHTPYSKKTKFEYKMLSAKNSI